MIEVVTRARAPEMQQRYQDTFGFLKSASGKKLLVMITSVDTRVTFVRDNQGNEYQLVSDTGCELEFTQVPSQWFQPDPDHIAYVTRKPDRQYKRGICTANTSVYVPRTHGASLSLAPTSQAKIEAIFDQNVEIGGFDDIPKIKCGLWSKFFAWAVNTVYVKDLAIGTVDHELKVINLSDDMFLQEMRDALIRSRSSYIAKVVNV